MKRNIAILSIVAGVGVIPAVHALEEASVWDGVYTAAQADRGQTLYTKACASCHRDKLEGHGPTPSLTGDSFREKWDGQTLDDLFEKMQTSMPADHPGSLSREENAALLAFMLRYSEFPAGEAELSADGERLAKIRFQAAKSK